MSIEVNGEVTPHVEGETVSELLARMNYVFPMVVVFVDGALIQEKDFASTPIKDGTKVEVVHLTSGG